MRRTVYLPDDLAAAADTYLRDHPGLSFSNLVAEALRARVAPTDISAFLERAGLLPDPNRPARIQPEDRAGQHEL
jgi:hypothetical protein